MLEAIPPFRNKKLIVGAGHFNKEQMGNDVTFALLGAEACRPAHWVWQSTSPALWASLRPEEGDREDSSVRSPKKG